MILFSTTLQINDEMTKDDFIELVIEWNQKSPHPENIISDIQWNGERNVRYGTEELWLDIQEYRNKNIIAVRYEKREDNGKVWDTDYVMNFNDMKLAIQLDRSYLEEALVTETAFSTPHFITLLIERGYLCADKDIPILSDPIYINKDNLQLVADVVNGNKKYQLPVVYVSRTKEDKEPVDVKRLAKRLKGVAHVLVQEDIGLNSEIRELCDSKNEFFGAIGVYYPNSATKNKRFLYREYDGGDVVMLEKIIHNVMNYCNEQRVEKLYTWQGVNNELLRDKLDSKVVDLRKAETETDEYVALASDEIDDLKRQIGVLTRTIDSLKSENQGLRAKMNKMGSEPVLFLGEENELFPDEIKAILIEELEKSLSSYEEGTRRHTVIQDIVNGNPCKKTAEEKSMRIKTLLKGYKKMSQSLKSDLEEMGFAITGDGKHYKLTYYGDGRYWTTLPKSASDIHSGTNAALEIKDMF